MRPSLLLSRDDAIALLAVIAFAASFALLIAGAVAARRTILGLPADFLSRGLPAPLSRTRAVLRIVAGTALAAVGVLLLVLPGPGVLLIVIGVLLCKPGWRRRIATAMLERPAALRAVNAYRKRHGREALRAEP